MEFSGGGNVLAAEGTEAIQRQAQSKEQATMIPNAPISELIQSKGGSVWTVSPETMVFDAIQMMSDKNIGALIVAEDGKMVGMMSERDYTRKIVSKANRPRPHPCARFFPRRWSA